MSEQISNVPFKFRIGEISLASIARRMVIRSGRPFSEVSRDVEVEAFSAELPADVQGLLVRSLPIREDLERVRLDAEWIRYVPHQYERYFADLTTAYDQYLKSFSRQSRSSLRRKVRRLEKESGGRVEWRTYRSRDEIEEFYTLARDVSAESYQERLLDAGLPESEEFRRDLLQGAENGSVLAFLIFFDSRPVAYLYCPVREGVVIYSHLGYRPGFESLSPGTVLLWLVMEQLFAEGKYRIFDFTEGGDSSKHSQKRLFSTGSVRCADVYWVRRTLPNLALVMSHAATESTVEHIGAFLGRLHVKRFVKRLTRRLWSAKPMTGI